MRDGVAIIILATSCLSALLSYLFYSYFFKPFFASSSSNSPDMNNFANSRRFFLLFCPFFKLIACFAYRFNVFLCIFRSPTFLCVLNSAFNRIS